MRRLVGLLPVLFGVSLLVFFIPRLVPGDPATVMLGERSSELQRERLREELGLNRPMFLNVGAVPESGVSGLFDSQYFSFVGGLFRGDLGRSIFTFIPGRAGRRAGSAEARHGHGHGHHDRRPGGRVVPRVLAGHHPHLRLRRQPRLAALVLTHRRDPVDPAGHRLLPSGRPASAQLGVRPRRAPAPRPARRRGGHHPARHRGAHDALGDARGARTGLHPYGPRQGPGHPYRYAQARAAERTAAGAHRHRPHLRFAPFGGDPDRDRLLVAGHRPLGVPGDLEPRLPDHPGRRALRGLHVRARQPAGRPLLRPDRPEDPVLMTEAVPATKGRSLASDAFRLLLRHPTGLLGIGIIVLFVLASVLAPFLRPGDPLRSNLQARRIAPTVIMSQAELDARGLDRFSYPFGTDVQGRDMLMRVLYGGRISLRVGLAAVAIAMTVGTLLGLIAGYMGGRVDMFIVWLIDILLAFPGILLAISIVAVLGPSLTNSLIAISITQ